MSNGSKQPELAGIVGYVQGDSSQIRGMMGNTGFADVRFEPGNDSVLFRVRTEDIVDVVDGSQSGGDQRVHLLLRPGASVETVIKQFRDVAAIEDPTLSRLSIRTDVSVSFV